MFADKRVVTRSASVCEWNLIGRQTFVATLYSTRLGLVLTIDDADQSPAPPAFDPTPTACRHIVLRDHRRLVAVDP